MIRLKRVYDPPAEDDGRRILVDRLWPRGLKKERARIDEWRKEWAPSDALRKWFKHDPAKWDEFCARYRDELAEAGRMEDLRELARSAKRMTITLCYGAADQEHNQAVALQALLKKLSR